MDEHIICNYTCFKPGCQLADVDRKKALGHPFAHSHQHDHGQHADGGALQAKKTGNTGGMGGKGFGSGQVMCPLYSISNDIKGAKILPVMQISPRGVKWNRTGGFGDFQHLAFGDKYEFGLRINKPGNQPGTGHTVDMDMGSGDPFHLNPPFLF
jgi:hypothetical protein